MNRHCVIGPTAHLRVFVVALLSVAFLLMSGCGGGGGGGGGGSASAAPSTTAPYILAEIISFPSGQAPAGFVGAGFNSVAAVRVQDTANGSPVTTASVSINGVILAYNPAYQDYEGEIVVAPGDSVTLNVTVGSTTYTASGTQFTSYPTIVAPQAGATWSSLDSNLASWSCMPPAGSLYALGVFDPDGHLVWPSGGSFQVLPTTTASFTFDPSALTAGNRLIFVGIGKAFIMPSAAPNSGMVVFGFNYAPIIVSSSPVISLSSIAVTPQNRTVVKGKTLQLTATGTYSNGSTQDLTTQVTWTSSDTAKATVSTAGLVTGVDSGSTTIAAILGGVSGSTVANVLQPTPSPSPPLSQSVAYQIDYAHSGRAVFADPITFPGSPTWSITLNGGVSYPLIAGGTVFVTTASPVIGTGFGTSLYALNKQTGSVVWGPITISGSFNWSGHAYDNGKIFVINHDGLLRSFDAATGQAGWSTQMPGQWFFNSPPTAVNGIVYVGGAGGGGTLYAVDESSGGVIWTASVSGGDSSSPAVSADGVFVTYPCPQAYKFDPFTGSTLWRYSGTCFGGGGRTPAYANGLLYMRDPFTNPGLIFDAATGALTGSFTAEPIPAFSTQTGFFLSSGTLKGIDSISQNVLWSFTGDGGLVSAPIVINQVVIVGSSSGNVYALDATTGSQIWSSNAGSPIVRQDEGGISQPLSGFGAGEGYLIVPAGDVLTGWHISGP